jgi:hypothetical protein
MTWQAQGDFVAWGQAFQQLPVTLTGGTNAVINSVVGSNAMQDAVPLHWNNQVGIHVGVDSPVGENWVLRAGYGYMSNPVPSATLLPLTAAIMRNSIATGAGWTHGHMRLDAAYQAASQLGVGGQEQHPGRRIQQQPLGTALFGSKRGRKSVLKVAAGFRGVVAVGRSIAVAEEALFDPNAEMEVQGRDGRV